jgi:hypothetical protein
LQDSRGPVYSGALWGKFIDSCSLPSPSPVHSRPPKRRGRYHDSDNGFSLQVPDDWVRLPEEVTDAGGRPCPAWRFEPQDDSWPALIIHVFRYEAFGIKGQITDEGIQAALDGQRSLFENDSGADVVSAEQEPLRRVYNLTVDHHVRDAETIRGRHAMAFGRARSVALTFLDLKDAWDSSEELRQTIFSSFVFDPRRGTVSPPDVPGERPRPTRPPAGRCAAGHRPRR